MNPCALITGGSRNIGQGIAITLAKYGYDIAITYATHPAGAQETTTAVKALGRRCFAYEAHLDEADGPEQAVQSAYADLGRLDVMVCNAGRDMRDSLLSLTAEQMDFLFANNLRNYLLCAGAAARRMVRDGTAGSIIFVTSVRGSLPHPDDCLYGALKAGVERACKSIALDLSEFNIRVNCIAPGAVWRVTEKRPTLDTPFIRESIPLHRSGTPADIGEAAAFLAGPQSGYITGTTLTVDGGLKLPGLLEQEQAIPWKHALWAKRRYAQAQSLLNEAEGVNPHECQD